VRVFLSLEKWEKCPKSGRFLLARKRLWIFSLNSQNKVLRICLNFWWHHWPHNFLIMKISHPWLPFRGHSNIKWIRFVSSVKYDWLKQCMILLINIRFLVSCRIILWKIMDHMYMTFTQVEEQFSRNADANVTIIGNTWEICGHGGGGGVAIGDFFLKFVP